MYKFITLFTVKRLIAAVICCVSLLLHSHGHSATRQALVIGNSDYGDTYQLINPLRDSTAIAAKLQEIGYTVHRNGPLLNLDLDTFNEEIDAFLATIEDGASTLVYYAGHGAASAGSNYLIPILPEGVILRSESDIRDRSISLQGILERVERRNPSGVNAFFFDACRDAPVDNLTRSVNLTGLASMDTRRQPRGSFVGFSTEYGQLALDGTAGDNSPFATAFLEALDTSAAAPIELFYKTITEQVYDETGGQQFPIQEAKLRGEYCIIDCQVLREALTAQEFGYLSVNTKPLDAEVCFKIDGWQAWNCERKVALPLREQVLVRVSAKGHKQYTTSTQLVRAREQITANLEPKSNRALFIIGGVAAAAVVGGLLLSGGSDSGSDDEGISIQLNPP